MTTQGQNQPVPQKMLGILRRRRWPILVAFAAALLTTLTAAFLWPPTYVSTGTILIEQQELPVDLVRSTISSFADQRIQMINQRVMTSENLLGIVKRYDLYAKERERKGRESILQKMRDDIKFGSIKASVIDPRMGRPVEATIAFSLGYQNRSPQIAARVANELSSLYLQENLESRKRLAEQAAGFLSDEADKLSRRIGELETQVAAFKEKHVGNLPGSSSFNQQLADRADSERRDVDTRISSVEQQMVFLDAQLAQISRTSAVYSSSGERVLAPADRLKYLRSEYARAAAIYAPDHPDVVRMKREMDGLAATAADEDGGNDRIRQLQEAQTQLASAREQYSGDHPDVQRLERMVASLGIPAPAAASTPAPVDPDNPAYIQLRAQREALANEQASLQRKRAELLGRVNTLEDKVAMSPAIEKDFMELGRELDSTQIKYREVRQKQMEAQLAQSLEDERKGERFTLIEPPLAPDEPASPNRKLLMVLGAVLALGLAAGVAALLEAVDLSIRGRHDVANLLTVPPLAVIPWIENAATLAVRARQRRYALAGSLATVLLAVIAIHLFYKPLDVLWAVAMRRLGS